VRRQKSSSWQPLKSTFLDKPRAIRMLLLSEEVEKTSDDQDDYIKFFPARFVRRRKIYTQNSPESSFGRRRSNLTPFYLTCILQTLSSPTPLLLPLVRPFFARQQFSMVLLVGCCRTALSTCLVRTSLHRRRRPPRVLADAGHVSLSFSFLFRLLFCTEVCKCASATTNLTSASTLPALTPPPHIYTGRERENFALPAPQIESWGFAHWQTRKGIAVPRFSALILLFGCGKIALSIKLSQPCRCIQSGAEK